MSNLSPLGVLQSPVLLQGIQRPQGRRSERLSRRSSLLSNPDSVTWSSWPGDAVSSWPGHMAGDRRSRSGAGGSMDICECATS